MFPPTPNPDPPQPLPLFRAEALAAQQQKFYGEILLIRPLSLTLLVWLGIGISATVLGFLILGTYTERAGVAGILLPGEVDLFIPAQAIKFVRPGESVQIHCQSCSQTEAQTRTATIKEISKSALSPDEISAQLNTDVREPMYRVKVVLPPDEPKPFPEGARITANLPLGRQPLLKWLFERGDSTETGDK